MESSRHPHVLPAATSPNTAPSIVAVLQLQEQATESGLGVAWMHLRLEKSFTAAPHRRNDLTEACVVLCSHARAISPGEKGPFVKPPGAQWSPDEFLPRSGMI